MCSLSGKAAMAKGVLLSCLPDECGAMATNTWPRCYIWLQLGGKGELIDYPPNLIMHSGINNNIQVFHFKSYIIIFRDTFTFPVI